MKRSTRALPILPQPDKLERLSMSLATLDAILSPEWQDRYYSFNSAWDTAKNHRMGSMRNGCGDEYSILFTPAGAAIKGYAHEYPMARPGTPPEGMFDGFPEAITEFLLELLTADPRDYQVYAKDYFEVHVPRTAIESVYSHRPLRPELVESVNAEVELAGLRDEFAEIGYPIRP